MRNMKRRNTYGKGFKKEAVRLVLEEGYSAMLPIKVTVLVIFA